MIKIISTYRTFAEQDALYAQGRTTPGNIITNARGGESFHNYKIAFDIYCKDYNKVGAIGKKIGLEWGGDWETFKDLAHFQLTLGYTIKDFIYGKIDYNKFL